MSWRRATPDDAVALRDLEREANLVGLAHVFGELPFPDDAVLARWRETVADPAVTVLMTEVAFSSWDDAGWTAKYWGAKYWGAKYWGTGMWQ